MEMLSFSLYPQAPWMFERQHANYMQPMRMQQKLPVPPLQFQKPNLTFRSARIQEMYYADKTFQTFQAVKPLTSDVASACK